MSVTVHIPDLFKAVTLKTHTYLSGLETPLAAYFEYGSVIDINKMLTEKSGTKTKSAQKYPLVWLKTGFKEIFSTAAVGYCRIPEVDVFFIELSDKEKYPKEIAETLLVNVLYPIYDRWIKDFENSGLFSGFDQPSEKIVFYKGVNEKGENIFPDFTTVLHVRFKNIIVNESVCASLNMRKAG